MSSLRSDNGTNFVGANKILKQSLVELNNVKIQDGIKWSFNTPAASHQGGVWEHLIRSVRSMLTSVLGQQVLNDEGLQMLFCEVEAILNDRPIAKVSDDPNDLEALTSNHILLPIFPPGLFEQSDRYIRRCRLCLIRQSPDSIRGGQKRLNTGKTAKSLSKAWRQIHYILCFYLVFHTNGFVLIKRTDVKSVVVHFIPFL